MTHQTVLDVGQNVDFDLRMRTVVIRNVLMNHFTVSFACTEVGVQSFTRHTPAGVPLITELIRKIRTACMRSEEFAYLFQNYAMAENDRSIISFSFDSLAKAMRFVKSMQRELQTIREGADVAENETQEVEMGIESLGLSSSSPTND